MGKLSERYHKKLLEEGCKRLKKRGFEEVESVHLKEEFLPGQASESEIKRSLDAEAERIFAKLAPEDYLLCLDIAGNRIEENLLKTVSKMAEEKNKTRLVFVVGSSHGLSERIKKRADFLLSFGDITLNHQIVPALILDILEQDLSSV